VIISCANGAKFDGPSSLPRLRAIAADVPEVGPNGARMASDRSAAPAIRVEALNSAGVAAWDRFVLAAPGATFFHRAGWKEVIERSFGHDCHFLQAKCDDRITGVLALVHVSSRLFGNALISNAYGVYGGPLASEQASLQALNEAAVRLAGQLDVDYLEYRLRAPSVLPLGAQFRPLRDLPQALGGGPRSVTARRAAQTPGDAAQGASARPRERNRQ
jgi:hypothetical protein